MKIYAITIILIVLIFSCRESEKRIDIIENLDLKYKNIEELGSESRITSGESILKSEQLKKEEAGLKKPFSLSYRLYISETGMIEKIKKLHNSDTKEIDNLLLNDMQNWRMTIINKNNTNVKYQMTWTYSGSAAFPVPDENFREEDFITEGIVPAQPAGGMAQFAKVFKYPEEALKKGIEGVTYLAIYVDESGNIKNISVIKSASKILDDAAIETITKLKFNPGLKNNKPVKCKIVIPIRFKLN